MTQEYAKECINAEDARHVTDALDKLIKNQEEKGAYEEDIRSTKTAKDAISRVLNHASFEYDEICFYVSSGTKKHHIVR